MTVQTETVAWLHQRTHEQARLRNRIEDRLRGDQRLVAAWWFGSYARTEPDALSDLDIWLVVDDRHLDTLIAERHRYVTILGQPLIKLEVWGNAPDPGAYIMANYLLPGGLYQVDWYWQGAAQARLPRDARLLFDRVGLPAAPDRITVDFARGSQTSGAAKSHPPDESRQPLAHRVSFWAVFFWSLVPIVAKKIARQELDAAEALLSGLVVRFNTIAAMLNIPAYEAAAVSTSQTKPASALSLLSALRRIVDAMQEIEPAMTVAGAALPAIHAPVQAHLDKIEQLVRAGVPVKEITSNAR